MTHGKVTGIWEKSRPGRILKVANRYYRGTTEKPQSGWSTLVENAKPCENEANVLQNEPQPFRW